jgi:Ca-activated chloride channel family protein
MKRKYTRLFVHSVKYWLAILLSCVAFVNLNSSVVLADGMIMPDFSSSDYIEVVYHHVTVNIDDGHAVTRVEQEFHNPYSTPVRGRYIFPVPPDGILSDFYAIVDGRPQSVTFQDASTTNKVLNDMVVQRYDPSLLRYTDWETIAFDIDLPANGSKRMTLEYEEVLVPSAGLYNYRYILSTERYSSRPVGDISLTVNLHSSSGLSTVYCSSHEVITDWPGTGDAYVEWQAQDILPTEDFDLFYAPADNGFGGGLLTGYRNDQDHFLFLFAPEDESADTTVIAKDIVFVIDDSGSMSGEKIEQAKNAIHFILNQLGKRNYFSIVGFDDYLSIFSPEPVHADGQVMVDARNFVDRLEADGSTDIEAALQKGLQILANSPRRDAASVIVFLTDGMPTAGVTDDALISHLVNEANSEQESRIHVFGVGYDVNTHLLDKLASENHGTVTYIQPGENLETVLVDFYETIAHPVLTDVEIEFKGIEVNDLYPEEIPDMFKGSSLLLAGRYHPTGSTATIRIRGLAEGKEREYVYRFNLSKKAEHDFVPRLWATRKVGELLDRVRIKGETPELVSEIKKLALNYGLVTPYTTYLIEAQTEGAASASNMGLYANQTELNQVSGQTTVQARLQNQMYQQASNAYMAKGANVLQAGQNNLAQIGSQNIDLSLLKEQEDIESPITEDWIDRNIKIDRYVNFGSKEYFKLAKDYNIRQILQSGSEVVFLHDGEVIAVIDSDGEKVMTEYNHDNTSPSLIQLITSFIMRILGLQP